MPPKHAIKPADPLPYTVPIGPKAASAPPAIIHADPKVASTVPAIIPTKSKAAQTTLAVAPIRPGWASRLNPSDYPIIRSNTFPEK